MLVSKFGDTVDSRNPFVQTIPKTGAIFPDLNVEITVREALSKPEGEIQPAEFGTLQTLRAPDKGITRLDGVEKLISLNKLTLQRNQISDISVLLSSPGIDSGDEINLTGNPLSEQAISTHIPALEAKGVKVEH